MKKTSNKLASNAAIDLPMTRIREAGGPRVTYYKGDADSSTKLPKEINGIVVKLTKNGSKKSVSIRNRSMSASSARSNKSFRATRKRPAGGDEILLTSKIRPTGTKLA